MFNIVTVDFQFAVVVKMFRDDNYHLKKNACSISMWVVEEKSNLGPHGPNPSQT